MAVENQKTNPESDKFPAGALIALISLAVALAALWFAFTTQKHTVTAMEKLNSDRAGQQEEVLSGIQENLQVMSEQYQASRGFMVKQYHYSQLMQLLSQTYVLTERLEPAALAEVHLRIADQFYAIEPFLAGVDRDWLSQQLKGIKSLSTKLSDPLQDYEENLLTTKTTLRNMIDETHAKTYGMLFPDNIQETDEGNGAE